MDWVDKWMAVESPRNASLRLMTQQVAEFCQAQALRRAEGYRFGDPLALMVAIAPQTVLRSERRHVVVETHGVHTRGMTVVDWRVRAGLVARGVPLPPDNVECVLELDMDAFRRMMMHAIA